MCSLWCQHHVESSPVPPLANSSRTSASHRQQPLINQFNKEEEALLVWARIVSKLGKRAARTGKDWVGAGRDLRVAMPQFTSPLGHDGRAESAPVFVEEEGELAWAEKPGERGVRWRKCQLE